MTVDEVEWLADRFEENRPHLRAVAYRMLGSLSEADDAVQESWLRLSRSHPDTIENLSGWLTTVVARVSLDMLRSRRSRREESLVVGVQDPILGTEEPTGPEHEALLADSVGLALLVVLETLAPPERLAFVLHDMFAVPFDEIAPIVGRTPTAARQLASRARRRVQGASTVSESGPTQQRRIVDAFLSATRDGDFDGLVAVLDPDVVLRSDRNAAHTDSAREVRGAMAVAKQASLYSQRARYARPALINGSVGLALVRDGRLLLAMDFVLRGERISEIDVIASPSRLNRIDLVLLDP